MTAPLFVMCCDHCCSFLRHMPPSIPPRSLANNNLCISPPPELQHLSLGEQLFVARGHALRRLRTLSHTGDPAARQSGILGTTSAIAFPQDPISILSSLPPTPESLCEYTSAFSFRTKPRQTYAIARSSSFGALSCILLCFGCFSTTLTMLIFKSIFPPYKLYLKTTSHYPGSNTHMQPIFLSHVNWAQQMLLQLLMLLRST